MSGLFLQVTPVSLRHYLTIQAWWVGGREGVKEGGGGRHGETAFRTGETEARKHIHLPCFPM
jgi:hypothetical protein